MAAFVSPTCRIAARSCACRRASMAGSRRSPGASASGFRACSTRLTGIEILLVGTGKELRPLPAALRQALKALRHLGRSDVDWRRRAHLQCPAGGKPCSGRRSDRGLSDVTKRRELVMDERCAPPIVIAISPRSMRPRTSASALLALYAFNAEIAGIRDRVQRGPARRSPPAMVARCHRGRVTRRGTGILSPKP